MSTLARGEELVRVSQLTSEVMQKDTSIPQRNDIRIGQIVADDLLQGAILLANQVSGTRRKDKQAQGD